MACDISKGRLEPCKDSVGGIMNVYFTNFGNKFDVDPTTDEITDINDGAEIPDASTFYKWEVKGATNLDQTVNSSRDNGTTFWEQVLNCQFKKITAETNKEIKLMSYGRPQIVVHDKNGKAFACGINHGMEVTGGTIVTGSAMGDLYGYTLVLTGQESLPANMLQGATIDDPFAGMTTPPIIVDGLPTAP